jgi:phage-related protein
MGNGWDLPVLSFKRQTNNLLVDVSNRGHNETVKAIDFHVRALEFIREQATSIRRHLGEALLDLQKGVNLGMPLSRPMPGIAPGVHEFGIRGEGATVSVFYYVRKEDAIIVFHAFQKKSQKIPSREIDLARQRLQEVLNEASKS